MNDQSNLIKMQEPKVTVEFIEESLSRPDLNDL
jgi:hypothetical protein